jgi:hypothetical protein
MQILTFIHRGIVLGLFGFTSFITIGTICTGYDRHKQLRKMSDECMRQQKQTSSSI